MKAAATGAPDRIAGINNCWAVSRIKCFLSGRVRHAGFAGIVFGDSKIGLHPAIFAATEWFASCRKKWERRSVRHGTPNSSRSCTFSPRLT
jgi:hypothetical protein